MSALTKSQKRNLRRSAKRFERAIRVHGFFDPDIYLMEDDTTDYRSVAAEEDKNLERLRREGYDDYMRTVDDYAVDDIYVGDDIYPAALDI